MIHTTLSNAKRPSSLFPGAEKAFEALKKFKDAEFVKGRREVDGDDIYINAVEYETKPLESSVFEAHRKYIDIMLMLEGEERIAYSDISRAGEITKEYDESGDYLLAKIPDDASFEYMKEGDIVIFFPEDCHAPAIEANKKCKVRKLIAKVRVK